MTPNDRRRWQKLMLGRLDVLRTKAVQAQQQLEARGLDTLEDRDDVSAAWRVVYERFPEDFKPPRAGDLARHLHFAQAHDFHDIVAFDIPAIEKAVKQYGHDPEELIARELDELDTDLEAWELLHAAIRDACLRRFHEGQYHEAVRAAVELLMDALRSLSGRSDDGDALIRGGIGVGKPVGFSSNSNDSEKAVTEGLKLILQGLYKGVRNPASHGFTDYSRLEAFQILATCSFLLGAMQLSLES